MELIECEGAGGYGIYWALMEYLRTQEDYVGKMVAVKTIARQMRTKPHKVDSVLRNYGLFVIDGNTFRSVKLEFVMKPLDDKRKAVEARSRRSAAAVQEQCSGSAAAVSGQNLDNSLETNSDSSENVSLIKKNKVKENKEDTSSISSSSAEAVEELPKPMKYVPAWEQYVDSLQQEEQWKELMAMRTGLKKDFYTLYPRIAESFKRHVRMLGNEGQILSPSDAKRYFCFYLDPGSVTFKKLWEELHKPIEKGKYKFEDRNPITGQRSYCGIPIPSDAPLRPNGQAVWNDGKWVY